MNSIQLDLWQDEVDGLPWGGRSPRLLAQQLVRERLERFVSEASCGVDNSVVGCPRREPLRGYVDSAQLCISVADSFKKEKGDARR